MSVPAVAPYHVTPIIRRRSTPADPASSSHPRVTSADPTSDGRETKHCAEKSRRCVTGCCMQMIIAICVVFLICSLVILAAGVWITTTGNSVSIPQLLLLEYTPTSPLFADEYFIFCLIGAGGCIAFISLVGCCGACAKNHCLLNTYAGLLAAVVTSQLICIVIVAATKRQVVELVESRMQHQIRYTYVNLTATDVNSEFSVFQRQLSAAWDRTHQHWTCCGATGPLDFKLSVWYNSSTTNDITSVPLSCCVRSDDDLVDDRVKCQETAARIFDEPSTDDVQSTSSFNFTVDNLYQQGCVAAVVDSLVAHDDIVAAVIGSVALFQMVYCVGIWLVVCCLLPDRRQDTDDPVLADTDFYF